MPVSVLRELPLLLPHELLLLAGRGETEGRGGQEGDVAAAVATML